MEQQNSMNIQWYPGHMTKTRRMMEEDLKLVDAVCEILDARIPISSRNPDIDAICGKKPRMVILNRIDMADPDLVSRWSSYFKAKGMAVIRTDCKSRRGINTFAPAVRHLLAEKLQRYAEKGQVGRPLKLMVVGIPNVGKSTFINAYAGRACAKTGNKPGVTKGKQWIRLSKQLELLDTPGILWPKFEDQQVGLKLAFTGAINDDILDPENMAIAFINHMISRNPDCLRNRYQITFDTIEEPHVILEKIAMARGFKKKGGEPDLERAGKILMDEYRGGKLGRLTLELPEDIDVMLEQKKARAAEKAVLDKERKKAYNNKKKK